MTQLFSVTVAPNGARRNKKDHPALPLTAEEIANTAKACFDVGASAIHLHVRNKDGGHSLDAGRYLEAMAAVSDAAPKMRIQITTESAGIYDVATQYACLKNVRPAAASVSVKEMARDTEMAGSVYSFADEAEIDVQHILYSPEDVAQLKRWMSEGVISDRMNSVIFVLGRYEPAVLAKPSDLYQFLAATEGMDLKWAICAFGRNELVCARAALQRGGDIRIGFENNIELPDGRLARDNTETVTLAVAEGRSLGLCPAPSKKAA